MKRWLIYFYFTLIAVLCVHFAQAQLSANTPKWGPNDTLTVTGIIYEGEVLPFKELEMVYVSNLAPEELAKAVAKYNRLRNAVYVTYPFARTAGVTLNDVNRQLILIKAKGDRKKYVKSREKELKDKFSDPLTNLSVYQGRVLMKLINRQTGNNCYEIIKEFKGSINARMYQTVAFFFGSSLKQDYDLADATDRQIENIVREIDGVWYNNPNKPGIR
jgi:hypothetical protein